MLAEILQWVERDEKRIAEEARRVQMAAQKINGDGGEEATDGEDDDANSTDEAAAAVMAAERSAARIERMGYDVGYRLCERLAQHRPLLGPGSPSPESGNADAAPSSSAASGGGAVGNKPIIMGGGGHHTVMDPKSKFTD